MSELEKQFRENLGMKPGQLLTGDKGVLGDILEVTETEVVIGIIATGEQVRLPKEQMLQHAP